MPELPEMQALAERLDAALAGTTLAAVDAIQFSALKTVTPAPADLVGLALARVTRRGKFLVLGFDGPSGPSQAGAGRFRLLIHLSQGGRIDLEDPPKDTRPRGAVVRFRFGAGSPAVLVKEFGKERKAGWWALEPGDDGPLADLGPEPGTPDFDTLLMEGDDGRRLNTLLRDQRTVAGIGRGYADDILHRARLSPFATLRGLGVDERRRLLDATAAVLDSALDGERMRSGGLPTKLGDRFTIHRRFGAPCPECTTTLARVSYESYELVYCPTCQTGGKLLADRRMSRLLR